jgi:hypothetical protein
MDDVRIVEAGQEATTWSWISFIIDLSSMMLSAEVTELPTSLAVGSDNELTSSGD